MLRDKKLFIFDLDGVILDSRSNMEMSWKEVQRQLSVDVPFSRYFELIGQPFGDIMRQLGLGSVAADAERIFRIASMERINMATFYDGVCETLQELTRIERKIAVVTSKDTLRTNAILALLPVDFTSVQTPCDRYRGKPAPDHLLIAMAECRVDPVDSVYLGDMEVDMHAATRAGIDYLHASWGYGERPAAAATQLNRFSDLLTLAGV